MNLKNTIMKKNPTSFEHTRRSTYFDKIKRRVIYDEIFAFLGLQDEIRCGKICKNFFYIGKKNKLNIIYFEFLKEYFEKIRFENFANYKNNEITSSDLFAVLEMINNSEKFIKKDAIFKNSILFSNIKILILIKILENKQFINLQFHNLLSDNQIKEYEIIIESLIYSKSINCIKLGNFLWDEDENFSFYKNFQKLFYYNSTIKTIILEGNILKRNDIEYLESALTQLNKIDELRIKTSGYVTNHCIKQCFDRFLESINIKKIDLCCNISSDMNNERAHFFSSVQMEYTKIKKMSIYRNQLSLICLGFLKESLSKSLFIESLKLRFETFHPEFFLKACQYLQNNTYLIELDFSCNNLNDLCIAYLCEYLKMNNKIRHLNLENNNIGDEGLKILSETLVHNDDIREFDISWNAYTDKGVYYLKEFLLKSKSIEKICVSKERLSDEGIKLIKEAFNDNKNIKKITFGISDISR